MTRTTGPKTASLFDYKLNGYRIRQTQYGWTVYLKNRRIDGAFPLEQQAIDCVERLTTHTQHNKEHNMGTIEVMGITDKYIITRKSTDGDIYWNALQNAWKVNRREATRFFTREEANAKEGEYLRNMGETITIVPV